MHYAICNETFADWDHLSVCQTLARLGYKGLEVAPYTLGESATELPAASRNTLRDQAEHNGVKIIGLHWLLAKTVGFHLTHLDATIRQVTAQYLVQLARLCRDLGGTFMVLGSPQQRQRLPGVSPVQAFDSAVDTLRRAMPYLGELGVRLCLEPLGTAETNFLNTCAEGMALVRAVEHPLCVLHLDVKAMAAECQTSDDGQAIARLMQDYLPFAGHFHANDPNRRGPGMGPMPFAPIMQALRQTHYAGWVSVEVFDYSPDPETIARESIRYLKQSEQDALREMAGANSASPKHG